MTIINIPDSVQEAVESLEGIGRLLTAREWERAAVVYALTHYEGGSRGPRSSRHMSETLTYQALADLGVTGLTSPKRVGWYHDQWQAVVDGGYADEAELGDEIEIPDDWEWPPNDTVGERDTTMTPERRETLMQAGREAGMRTGSKVVDVAANPRSLQAAIKADPATLRAAEEAVEEARAERHAKAVRQAGGNPDLPVEPFDGELAAEATRIAGVLIGLRTRTRMLRDRCEDDQWAKVQPIINEALTAYTVDFVGNVPDTIEGLIQ